MGAINDFTVAVSPAYHIPVIAPFLSGTTADAGVAFVENDGSGDKLYFDRVQATTSINNLQKDFFVQIENPVKDYLNIHHTLKADAQVMIYDVSGKLVQQHLLLKQNSFSRFAVSNLANGIYVCTIVSDGVKESQKIVISRN